MEAKEDMGEVEEDHWDEGDSWVVETETECSAEAKAEEEGVYFRAQSS